MMKVEQVLEVEVEFEGEVDEGGSRRIEEGVVEDLTTLCELGECGTGDGGGEIEVSEGEDRRGRVAGAEGCRDGRRSIGIAGLRKSEDENLAWYLRS